MLYSRSVLFSLKKSFPAFLAAGLLATGFSFAQGSDSSKKDSTVSVSTSSSTSTTQESASETTFGGYGEIGYNNYPKSDGRNIADLKRFVLFVGHRFNDQWSFNSEVEWEHAVTSFDDQGESEIEQAYLNYQITQELSLKAGLFLMPFGLLNESHEPPVFYGVERNEVETRIIPSTWREGGLGLSGNNDLGLDWNVGVTTGFDVAKFDDAGYPLASSHQELQLAKTNDLAYYGALNYRGVPGFVVGGALFTGKGMQDNADFIEDNTKPDFSGIDGRVTLWDVHTRWQAKGWDLQAVYAHGTISEADKIDAVLDTYNTDSSTSLPLVPEQFMGWLVQGSYTFWLPKDMTLSPFVRYEMFDTELKMPAGFAADPADADRVGTLGFSFKPITQIVFKADFQKYFQHAVNNRWNLGLGYMF